MSKRQYYAPVAEWLGVALLEKRGRKRASWRGQEYRTDGHIYLMAKHEPGSQRVGFFQVPIVAGLSCEQLAKEGIENMTVAERSRLASWAEVWCVLEKRDDPPPTPRYAWDDQARVFVREGDR
jgi:hypothetical protein